jgi:ABC-type Fe3+-hydroxamate transport system substrate-binding protein
MILSSPKELANKPKRIVSLVPSQTELLAYLGLEEETIAITKFCVHPEPWFRNKTRIGGTKAIDIEKIILLQPDCIIANKEENVKDQVEALAEHFPVWLTDVNNLDEALQMIHDIGTLTHTTERASQLVSQIENNFNAITPAASDIPVAYLIWKDPYMTVGGDTFINDMIEKGGMQNVFSDRKRYPEISIEQLKNSRCRLVLLSSEPYPFSLKHVAELESSMPGVKIILADGEIFSWYGSRLLMAPEYFESLTRVNIVA